MMRRESPADDRLHVVHHLARLAADEDASPDVHLDIGDLAALTAGTLFESECTRVENHLLVCRACRDAAAALHREYEAGAVPILMRRRAPTGPTQPSISERIARRWSPTIIALLVFAAVLTVTAGRSLFFESAEVASLGRRLVVGRVGSPDVRTADSSLRPAVPGQWLERGETLSLEPGDMVTLVSDDGALHEVSMDRDEVRVESALLEEIFAGGIERWTSRRRELGMRPLVDDAAEGVVVLHPIGRTLDRRPTIVWSDPVAEESYVVRLLRVGGSSVFEIDARGRRQAFPAPKVSLLPGQEYVVRVERAGGRHTGAESRFSIIDGPARTRVTEELDVLDRLIGRETNVLRAELLWLRGLHGEARLELERLRSRDASNLHVLGRLKLLLSDLGLAHHELRIFKLLEKRGLPR